MIRAVVTVEGSKTEVNVEHEKLTEEEVGRFLLRLHNVKKDILKAWKEQEDKEGEHHEP